MNRDIARWAIDGVAWVTGIFLSVFLVADALAGERGSSTATPANATWQAECGSCHVAYPPRFLTADGWHRIMQGLDRHFGADAGVDAGAAAEIGAFLAANAQAPDARRGAGGEIRITQTRWFLHEHGELAPAVFARPAVRSAANCGACHAGAERGRFSERDVRIPRG